ncbi:MAG: hypothetical protein QN198_11555 [Armatimonadota bacterium]|nr:hypothetical protein [Armatimonadota bacterium]MDR5704220.1 hypothetical protein [Armatimonadota bacterium]
MTNTLHRYGPRQEGDYIVFAIPARGINDAGCEDKLQAFLRLASRFNPVNMGNGKGGSLFRPERSLNPFTWFTKRRRHKVSPNRVIEEIEGPCTAAATFDSRDAVCAVLKAVKEADLGVSVNVSGPIEGTYNAAQEAGITPHSIEYSLEFHGRLDLLPEAPVLELITMCGHGMVSRHLARKVAFLVKEGRLTSEEAAIYLAKPCVCGAFNPAKAQVILEEMRHWW